MKETWYDVYRSTPETERGYYVYLWLERSGEDWVPFYVGMGSGDRWKNRSNRSKTFREYVSGREVKSLIVAPELPSSMALYVEHRLKMELRSRGYILIDGEDDRAERKRRQREGIQKAIENGVRFGRPTTEVEVGLKPGETVKDACARLGISRATFYRKAKEATV